MTVLRVAVNNRDTVHVLPKNVTKASYNGDLLMFNDTVVSSQTKNMFVGQIVGGTLHLVPVESICVAAYAGQTYLGFYR